MQRVLQRVARPEEVGGGSAAADREAAWDLALPERWPTLVAKAQAAGEPLASTLMRMLERRREQWLRRWRRDWPL